MTQEITEYDYLRAWVTGCLQCLSPMHVGSGNYLDIAGRDCTGLKKGEKGRGGYAAVYSGVDNRPRIPASGLRGALRTGLDVTFGTEAGHLFGYALGNNTRAGALRVFDAEWESSPAVDGDHSYSPSRCTVLQQGVAIDPVTGTAREHQLFSVEVVPAGSIFKVELEVHCVNQAHLDLLVGLLARLDGGETSRLGAGRNRGWGRVKWQLGKVCAVEKSGVTRWLQSEGASIRSCAREILVTPARVESGKILSLPVSIRAEAPFLVNDPVRVGGHDGDPDMEFMRNVDGHALVPGSTLRGWMRGRARRIVATIAHLHHGVPAGLAAEKTGSMIERLFGRESWRSPVWVTDAISDSPVEAHEQFFNAIDRFTGGVADGALYNVRAAPAGTCLKSACQLEIPRLEKEGDWWKGLLLLVARDAADGELLLGWGKAKGYGVFRLTAVSDCRDLADFSARQGEEARQWLKALHEKVGEVCKECEADRGREEVRA